MTSLLAQVTWIRCLAPPRQRRRPPYPSCLRTCWMPSAPRCVVRDRLRLDGSSCRVVQREVTVSCVQLPADGPLDMLHAAASPAPRLTVCVDHHGDAFCAGALSVRVSSALDCERLCLVLRDRVQTVGDHVLVSCDIRERDSKDKAPWAKLVLVALNPAERGGASSSTIALQKCLRSLRFGNPYVPFRACTLTQLLKVRRHPCAGQQPHPSHHSLCRTRSTQPGDQHTL